MLMDVNYKSDETPESLKPGQITESAGGWTLYIRNRV
jgi:hypothetical protein